ncbi:hypothetical protein V1477_019448, partial [Vespula maculifrons]
RFRNKLERKTRLSMPSSFGRQTYLIVFLSKSLLPRDGLLLQSTIRTPLDRHFWLTLNHFGDKNDKATERVTLQRFRSNEQYEIQCINKLFMHKQAGNCCFMDRNIDHPKVDVKLHLYEYQLHFDKLNRSSRWAINLSSSLVAEFSSSSNLFRKLTIGASQRSTSCLRWIALYCIEDNKRFGSSDILRAEGATRATVNLTSDHLYALLPHSIYYILLFIRSLKIPQLFLKRTLQVEGLKSLKEAVVRALEIKDIQENNIFHFLHNQVKSDRNVQLVRFSRKSSSRRDEEKDCRDNSFWNSNESK